MRSPIISIAKIGSSGLFSIANLVREILRDLFVSHLGILLDFVDTKASPYGPAIPFTIETPQVSIIVDALL